MILSSNLWGIIYDQKHSSEAVLDGEVDALCWGRKRGRASCLSSCFITSLIECTFLFAESGVSKTVELVFADEALVIDDCFRCALNVTKRIDYVRDVTVQMIVELLFLDRTRPPRCLFHYFLHIPQLVGQLLCIRGTDRISGFIWLWFVLFFKNLLRCEWWNLNFEEIRHVGHDALNIYAQRIGCSRKAYGNCCV